MSMCVPKWMFVWHFQRACGATFHFNCIINRRQKCLCNTVPHAHKHIYSHICTFIYTNILYMYTSLYIVMTLNTRVTNDKTASRLKSCSDQKKKTKNTNTNSVGNTPTAKRRTKVYACASATAFKYHLMNGSAMQCSVSWRRFHLHTATF